MALTLDDVIATKKMGYFSNRGIVVLNMVLCLALLSSFVPLPLSFFLKTSSLTFDRPHFLQLRYWVRRNDAECSWKAGTQGSSVPSKLTRFPSSSFDQGLQSLEPWEEYFGYPTGTSLAILNA